MLRTLTLRLQPRIIGTEHSPLPALGSADLLGGAQYGQGRCLCRNHSCTKTGLGLRGCLCKAIRLRGTRACSLIAALRPLGVVIGATCSGRHPAALTLRGLARRLPKHRHTLGVHRILAQFRLTRSPRRHGRAASAAHHQSTTMPTRLLISGRSGVRAAPTRTVRDDGRHCPMHVDAPPEARSMATKRLAKVKCR
jgi:hypothetical protein